MRPGTEPIGDRDGRAIVEDGIAGRRRVPCARDAASVVGDLTRRCVGTVARLADQGASRAWTTKHGDKQEKKA